MMEKVAKARTSLLTLQPFWALMALRLQFVEDDGTHTKTAATDGKRVWFYPPFVDSLRRSQVTGLIAHEVLHVIFGHHLRRGTRDPKLWNDAADYVINLELISAGFEMPATLLLDEDYAGMSTERVYSLLKKAQHEERLKTGDKREPGKADEIPGRVVDLADYLTGTPLSETQRRNEQARLAVNMHQAKTVAQKRGEHVPGSIVRQIEQSAAYVDWRDVLADFATQAVSGRDDYTWTRPKLFHLQQTGVYLPSLYGRHIPPLPIAVDTSGSMSAQQLRHILAALRSLVVQNHEIELFHIDSEIRKTQRLTTEADFEDLQLEGGGGTDFRPFFETLAERDDLTPEAAIYLTDLSGEFPEEPPPYPVLWVDYGGHGHDIPFGRKVELI